MFCLFVSVRPVLHAHFAQDGPDPLKLERERPGRPPGRPVPLRGHGRQTHGQLNYLSIMNKAGLYKVLGPKPL